MADVDRSRLQREILDLVQQHGERRRRRRRLLCDLLVVCWRACRGCCLWNEHLLWCDTAACCSLPSLPAAALEGDLQPMPPAACNRRQFMPRHPARRPLAMPPSTEMAPIYEEVCAELGAAPDANRLAQMRERNAARLVELEEKITDAGGSAAVVSVGMVWFEVCLLARCGLNIRSLMWVGSAVVVFVSVSML